MLGGGSGAGRCGLLGEPPGRVSWLLWRGQAAGGLGARRPKARPPTQHIPLTNLARPAPPPLVNCAQAKTDALDGAVAQANALVAAKTKAVNDLLAAKSAAINSVISQKTALVSSLTNKGAAAPAAAAATATTTSAPVVVSVKTSAAAKNAKAEAAPQVEAVEVEAVEVEAAPAAPNAAPNAAKKP